MRRYQYLPALYLTLLLGSATALAQTSVVPETPPTRGKVAERFAAADANHDGKLTREEADAKMPMVGRNFEQIDKTKKGYVTLDDIQAYAKEKSAQRRAAPPATTTN